MLAERFGMKLERLGNSNALHTAVERYFQFDSGQIALDFSDPALNRARGLLEPGRNFIERLTRLVIEICQKRKIIEVHMLSPIEINIFFLDVGSLIGARWRQSG